MLPKLFTFLSEYPNIVCASKVVITLKIFQDGLLVGGIIFYTSLCRNISYVLNYSHEAEEW